MPINTTFSSGQILNASAVNNFPFGMVSAAKVITATQTPITTVVDVTGTSTTFTAISGHIYLASWSGLVNSDANATAMALLLTNSANTIYGIDISYIATSGVDQTMSGSAILSGLSGSVTYKLRAQRQSGTGNLSIVAGATFPFNFTICDIGSV
jgi:hypothetical protein